ncbi:MAG: PTS sugar transporter subunit IIC, partial [Longicatena sp.]
GGVMPAIGFALIMNMIGKPKMIPFTVLGFIIVKAVGLNTLTAGLVAACVAVLIILEKRDREKETA